jgi:hypothetical protein
VKPTRDSDEHFRRTKPLCVAWQSRSLLWFRRLLHSLALGNATLIPQTIRQQTLDADIRTRSIAEVLSEIRKFVSDHIAKIDELTKKLHKAELDSLEQSHQANALLKKQENDRRAEIDEAEKVRLQARFDQATAEKERLQARFDQATAEKERLQARFDQATAKKVRLQARFDQATAEKERLQTELAQEKAEKSQNMIRFVATIGLVIALVYGAFGIAPFTRMKKMESLQVEMKDLFASKFECLQAEYLSESSTAKDMIPKHELETLRVDHLKELEAHKDELERLQSEHKNEINRFLLYVGGLH